MVRTFKLKDDVVLTVEGGTGKSKKAFKIRKIAPWNMAQVSRLMVGMTEKNSQKSLEGIHGILFRDQAEESLKLISLKELIGIIKAVAEEQAAPFRKKSPRARQGSRSRSGKPS